MRIFFPKTDDQKSSSSSSKPLSLKRSRSLNSSSIPRSSSSPLLVFFEVLPPVLFLVFSSVAACPFFGLGFRNIEFIEIGIPFFLLFDFFPFVHLFNAVVLIV